MDPTTETLPSAAIELNTSPTLYETRDSKEPDSSPDSEPSTPLLIKSDWAPIMELLLRTSFSTRPLATY